MAQKNFYIDGALSGQAGYVEINQDLHLNGTLKLNGMNLFVTDGDYESSGVTSMGIADLADVDMSNASDGQSLVYNASTQSFELSSVSSGSGSGATTLSALTDVGSGDTAANGDMVLYDGSSWGYVNYEDEINTRITAANANLTLHGLSDVGGVDTVATGDMILYDGSAWSYVNLEDEINTRITTVNANTALTGLTDVGFTGDTVANGDFLLYDDSTSKFGFVNFESEVQTYAQAVFPNIQHAGYGANVNGKLAVAGGIDMSLGTTLELEMGTVNFSGSTVVLDGDKVGGLDNETVGLDNITNAAYGVNVTGRVAATDGLEVSIGGTIDAQACTVDMRNSTVLFNGATVGGLDASANTSVSQPTSPNAGDLWFDATNSILYVYNHNTSTWVDTTTVSDLANHSVTELGDFVAEVQAQIVSQLANSLTVPRYPDDPSSGMEEGQIYFNTSTKQFRGFNGTAWGPLM